MTDADLVDSSLDPVSGLKQSISETGVYIITLGIYLSYNLLCQIILGIRESCNSMCQVGATKD